jgi:hypothetical protein
MSRSLGIVRLRGDPDGESRFEASSIDMAEEDFVPPAEPFAVSQAVKADSYLVVELPRGWGGKEPHPTPGRIMMFCLAGRFRLTSSEGETRDFGPGDGVLLEDVTGKGHQSEVLSAEPVRCVLIRLP